MKILRIIIIILIIIWMSVIFYFSNQPGNKSKDTSSSVTKIITKIIYNEESENFEEQVKKLDPIIRKLAHYTVYLARRSSNYNSITYI